MMVNKGKVRNWVKKLLQFHFIYHRSRMMVSTIEPEALLHHHAHGCTVHKSLIILNQEGLKKILIRHGPLLGTVGWYGCVD
jgi:hypothetical protein